MRDGPGARRARQRARAADTSPSPRARAGACSCTCRPTTSSTARRARRTTRWTRRTPSPCTGGRSSRGSGSCGTWCRSTSSCGRATCSAAGDDYAERRASNGSAGARAPAASATGSDRRRSSGTSRLGCCRCCSPAGSARITWPGPSPRAGSTSCSACVRSVGSPGRSSAQAVASLGLVGAASRQLRARERVPRAHRDRTAAPAGRRRRGVARLRVRGASADGAG